MNLNESKEKYGKDGMEGISDFLKKNGINKSMSVVAQPASLGLRNMAADPVRLISAESTQRRNSVPDSVKNTARELALDIVHYVANNNRGFKLTDKHSRTMRRTVDEMSARHDILFKSMMDKLEFTRGNIRQTFENVADEIFKDKKYNWGRVVSVYAFGGRIAKYCAENGLENNVDTTGEIVGEYVAEKLSWWIQEQGGWDSFDEYFPDQNSLEDKIWKGLFFTAVGLGALATMVAAR